MKFILLSDGVCINLANIGSIRLGFEQDEEITPLGLLNSNDQDEREEILDGAAPCVVLDGLPSGSGRHPFLFHPLGGMEAVAFAAGFFGGHFFSSPYPVVNLAEFTEKFAKQDHPYLNGEPEDNPWGEDLAAMFDRLKAAEAEKEISASASGD